MRITKRGRHYLSTLAAGLGLLTQTGLIRADSPQQETSGDRWQEWALSIPPPVNLNWTRRASTA